MKIEIPETVVVVTSEMIIDRKRTGDRGKVPDDLPPGSLRMSGTIDEIEDQIENVIHFAGTRGGNEIQEKQAEVIRSFIRMR